MDFYFRLCTLCDGSRVLLVTPGIITVYTRKRTIHFSGLEGSECSLDRDWNTKATVSCAETH